MPKRANNEGSIRQRDDGRWEARYTAKIDARTGRQVQRSVYADTKENAAKRLREALNEVARGEVVDHTKITLHSWLDQWIVELVAPLRTPGTVAGYYASINAHIKPLFPARVRLASLTPQKVQAFVNALASKGLAASTIKKAYAVLSIALRDAAAAKLIKRNPCHEQRIQLPTIPAPVINPLSPDQQAAFVAALPASNMGRAVHFALLTGMRTEEIIGLRWKDIDLESISIENTARRTTNPEGGKGTMVISGVPKSDRSRRKIPIDQDIRDILDAQYAMNKAREYVFAGRTGKPVENSGLRRLTTVTAARLGFKAGMHALRHTFATNAIRAGVDMRTLAELLGHSDVAFTMQVYGHSDVALKVDAIARIHNAGKASKGKNTAIDGDNV